ncbi:hypothetical protein HIM_11472 [Hirsutella minnesotensis 3608]|uniref:FTP domain-containing protein n=1 Tax=Hirsutella minnesotensis 3608 TaxID=1043627 RepID=A0A0F7ZJ11_9HYPO|nr:hypothetical protein HIM_11472 [Hirsutella minnesotensis 3608]
MFGIKHVLLFGLVTLSAALRADNLHALDRRALPLPPGPERIPLKIHFPGDSTDWTRNEISTAIDNAFKNHQEKPFGNAGVKRGSHGRWTPKNPLFEGNPGKLFEVDLTKSTNRGKYRAIVTTKKVFVGITEHVEQDNVWNFYDVYEQAQSGAFINGGRVPDPIPADGRQISRKSVADAMQSQSRKKVNNEPGVWKTMLEVRTGKTTESFAIIQSEGL